MYRFYLGVVCLLASEHLQWILLIFSTIFQILQVEIKMKSRWNMPGTGSQILAAAAIQWDPQKVTFEYLKDFIYKHWKTQNKKILKLETERQVSPFQILPMLLFEFFLFFFMKEIAIQCRAFRNSSLCISMERFGMNPTQLISGSHRSVSVSPSPRPQVFQLLW